MKKHTYNEVRYKCPTSRDLLHEPHPSGFTMFIHRMPLHVNYVGYLMTHGKRYTPQLRVLCIGPKLEDKNNSL